LRSSFIFVSNASLNPGQRPQAVEIREPPCREPLLHFGFRVVSFPDDAGVAQW
jgi:hypothetical protein